MGQVVIVADDLGLSSVVNRAILAGLDSGWLTGASVLATSLAFEQVAPALAGRELGLHADVSEFPSLLGPLPRRHRGWYLPGAKAALVNEITAQAERILATGARLTHADSHQHLHYQPVVLAALREVAKKLGIPWIRGVSNVPPASGQRRLRHAAAASFVGAGGVRTLAAFGPAGAVRSALEKGWRPTSLEIMCHPGRGEGYYRDEVEWLVSQPFAAFELVPTGYAQVGQAQRGVETE